MRTPASMVRDSPVRGHLVAALVLLSLTLVGVLAIAMSPTSVYWTGTRVAGVERGGVVYYRWHGEQYTLPGTGAVSDLREHRHAVWLHPDAPSEALADGPSRWVDTAFLLVWPVAAAVVLAVGHLRRLRRRRARAGDDRLDWSDFARHR